MQRNIKVAEWYFPQAVSEHFLLVLWGPSSFGDKSIFRSIYFADGQLQPRRSFKSSVHCIGDIATRSVHATVRAQSDPSETLLDYMATSLSKAYVMV